jgi:hypothetical protein
VVGWFLGGKKMPVPGPVSFFADIFVVFLDSPHRETPKNQKGDKRKLFCQIFL